MNRQILRVPFCPESLFDEFPKIPKWSVLKIISKKNNKIKIVSIYKNLPVWFRISSEEHNQRKIYK